MTRINELRRVLAKARRMYIPESLREYVLRLEIELLDLEIENETV